MQQNITVHNAQAEYDKFVAAHLDPKIVYGKHAGWYFPGSSGWANVTGPGKELACSLGADYLLKKTTVKPEIYCPNPSKIADDIFNSVLEYIQKLTSEKVMKRYETLFLSFKKIGKLKLNRLKNDPKFNSLCNKLLDGAYSDARRKKLLEDELSNLVKKTMKEIINHIPSCKQKQNFEKFIFDNAELALNNLQLVPAAGTGTLVAESLPAPAAANRTLVAESLPRAVTGRLVAESLPRAGTGTLVAESLPAPAGTGTLVAESLPPVGTGTLVAESLPLAIGNQGINENENENDNTKSFITAKGYNSNNNNNNVAPPFKPLRLGGAKKTRKQKRKSRKSYRGKSRRR